MELTCGLSETPFKVLKIVLDDKTVIHASHNTIKTIPSLQPSQSHYNSPSTVGTYCLIPVFLYFCLQTLYCPDHHMLNVYTHA